MGIEGLAAMLTEAEISAEPGPEIGLISKEYKLTLITYESRVVAVASSQVISTTEPVVV